MSTFILRVLLFLIVLVLKMAKCVKILLKHPQRLLSGKQFIRSFSSPNVALKESFDHNESTRMSAWQVHCYGSFEELQFTNSARSPSLMSPNEVLVKVLAASVNPIDVHMMNGYGSQIINALRQCDKLSLIPEVEFPLILGRDCCGEILAKGNNVGNELSVGDVVYGVIPVQQQGCHAQKALLHKDRVKKIPSFLSIEEASSLFYVGLTAWSALKLTGDLWFMSPKSKKVLVLGASGGVGTVAVQLLKAWNAEVVATCSENAVPLVKSLNPDHVIDYTKPDALDQMASLGKYDVILDAAGVALSEISPYTNLLKEWSCSKFITLTSPMLRNFDQYGFVPGLFRNAGDLFSSNYSTGAITRGSSVRWAFFMPDPNGIEELHNLISTKQIKPVIHKVYNFSDLPQAYKDVQKGHLRGKIVVNVESRT